jgi:hypothetical protein
MKRTTEYSTALAVKICSRVADGDSVRKICQDDDMPSKSTVFNWLAAHPEFVTMYEVARDIQADACFDEVLEIADDGRNDWMERNDPKNPGWAVNGEHIQRSRVRIDTRKWKLARMNAKKYGDKLDLGTNGGPLQVLIVDPKRKKEGGED